MSKTVANMDKDGLSNVDYKVVEKADYKTHIWILADLKRYGKGLNCKIISDYVSLMIDLYKFINFSLLFCWQWDTVFSQHVYIYVLDILYL